ncbi:MAG: hypothetical protein NT080_07815 [Spirochaetes bacterium]|nr:hypothetical protein [Spirochaetota bacterium]
MIHIAGSGMMKSGRPVRPVIFLAFLMAAAFSAYSEVIFLSDGQILIGSLIGPVESGISYRAFGAEITIPLNRILKTEKMLSSIADTTLNIRLKDGSQLKGKIVDYDEEIGLFVDIGFGVLTVPIPAIAEIFDLPLRERFAGSPAQVRAGAGLYIPLLGSGDYFGPSWTSVLGALVSLPFMRGLYAGIELGVSGADYLDSDTTSYLFASVEPELELRFMGWRMKDGFLGKMTPFASLRGGMTYISLKDPDFYPPDSGSLTGSFGLAAGMDFAVANDFGARLDWMAGVVLQSTTPFVTTGLRLSVSYDF